MASGKVMIVEDDPQNMKLFNVILECRGYETVQMADGEKAVEAARQHRPDLIILDILLSRISGLDVVREIKDDGGLKDIPGKLPVQTRRRDGLCYETGSGDLTRRLAEDASQRLQELALPG